MKTKDNVRPRSLKGKDKLLVEHGILDLPRDLTEGWLCSYMSVLNTVKHRALLLSTQALRLELWLRVNAALAKGSWDQLLAPQGASQPHISSVPGILTPSSGLPIGWHKLDVYGKHSDVN